MALFLALWSAWPWLWDPTWDPRHRGVALDDLGTLEAQLVHAQLDGDTLGFDAVLSASLVERTLTSLTADVVALAGGDVWVERVRVPLGDACEPSAPTVLWLRSLAALALEARVSIGDALVVLSERETGFRRVLPLGLGGVDTLHLPGRVTSLTPTSELARLDKDYATRHMRFPKNYQGKPHLPLSVPYPRRADAAPDAPLVYHVTWLAFHIWQGRGFERGHHSHGCLRMRDADLDELAAFVFGAPRPIPLVLRAPPIGDVHHPLPATRDHYTRLRNFGSERRPAWRIINDVWVTETVRGSPPAPEAFVGLTIDPQPADGLEPLEGW